MRLLGDNAAKCGLGECGVVDGGHRVLWGVRAGGSIPVSSLKSALIHIRFGPADAASSTPPDKSRNSTAATAADNDPHPNKTPKPHSENRIGREGSARSTVCRRPRLWLRRRKTEFAWHLGCNTPPVARSRSLDGLTFVVTQTFRLLVDPVNESESGVNRAERVSLVGPRRVEPRRTLQAVATLISWPARLRRAVDRLVVGWRPAAPGFAALAIATTRAGSGSGGSCWPPPRRRMRCAGSRPARGTARRRRR